jgi:hypothetical protein
MKALLKTLPEDLELKVDEVFTSKENKKITKKLVPELLDLLKPRYNPTQTEIHKWLAALHRHQRGRYLKKKTGKLDADNRRIHANSRLNEVCFGFFDYYLNNFNKLKFFIEIL